jgi:hypothetical protein
MKFFTASVFLALGGVAAVSQSLPNLSVNLNAAGNVHVVWTVPTVSSVLQEASSLGSTGAWQTSTLNIITNGCNCQVLAPATNTSRFYRLASTNPPAIGIYLGPPTQLLAPHELGMTDVPDMHTAILQQSNTYRLWIAGRFENDTVAGATGLLVTTNFVNFTSGYSPSSTNVAPVFVPSSRGSNANPAYYTNFDADYAGADLVWTATNGADLLMLYHGETWAFGTNAPNSHSPGWAAVGLARSSDNGITWSNRQIIITGSDTKPDTNPPIAQIYGTVEPGAIIASNYTYAYYAYFALSPATNPPDPVIQVARSALTTDGAPGTWTNYLNGSFSQPALGGRGSSLIPTACGCTRTAQPWPVYSTYLNAYVLVFIATEGWFFSTSTDLVNWSSPTQFFTSPSPEFAPGLPVDENVILVTPGNPVQVIGQTGLVLYAHSPAWRNVSHELWSRPFTFSKTP